MSRSKHWRPGWARHNGVTGPVIQQVEDGQFAKNLDGSVRYKDIDPDIEPSGTLLPGLFMRYAVIDTEETEALRAEVAELKKQLKNLPRPRERVSAPIPGKVFWVGSCPTKFLLSGDGRLYHWDREYSDSPKEWLPWHDAQGWLFDGTPLYAEPLGYLPSHLTFAPKKEEK